MKYLIKGARLLDPGEKLDKKLDLLIQNGIITKIAASLDEKGAEIIKGDGLVAFPGLFDMHAHLREPGREDEETIETGMRAAIKGGFTGLCCMPNTAPVLDEAALLTDITQKAEKLCSGFLHPAGAITKGLAGEELSEMGELSVAGAVAFTDDGHYVQNALVMRRALEYSSLFKAPLLLHEEDSALAKNGQMNEGFVSTSLGLKGIPASAETVAIARDLELLKEFGGRIHIQHLSTQKGLELIRKARDEGLEVTAEVTPHHLILTDEELDGYDTNLKVNPPLRSEEDRSALRDGLKSGLIDAVATDHAPHALQEKANEFDLAPFGMIGLETAFALVFTELVKTGFIDFSTLISKMSAAPRRILGLPPVSLKVGGRADLCLAELEKKFRIDPAGFESKSRNTPFAGREVYGSIEHVFCGGRTVIKNGRLL